MPPGTLDFRRANQIDMHDPRTAQWNLTVERDLGRDFGVPLDLAALTTQTFIRAREAYGGGAWSTQVVKLLEDALRADLRAPGFPAEL